MDFSGGAEIYDGLAEKLAALDIGILGQLFIVHKAYILPYNVFILFIMYCNYSHLLVIMFSNKLASVKLIHVF